MKVFSAVILTILLIFPVFGGTASASDVGFKAALADYDECLTASEEQQLLQIMTDTANKIKCNVGIVITRDLNGMSDSGYAKNFGDTNFGGGSSYAVLMLLNTHDNPAYAGYEDKIELNGKGHDYYAKHANSIFNSVYDGLDSSGFYAAGREFCRALERYAGSDGGSSAALSGFLSFIFGGAIFGLIPAVIITIIIVTSTVKGYKKRAPISAGSYIDQNRTRITRQVDQFVREYTTSHVISSSSGGSHGGHSSHGGSHRSDGHSSHGGRHR
ncbi:MAG: TPM domain-containing protein [Lachnospiraceae bacterium]|nr:TPM domain-containing protein [Ruminococcus sp.]MCM1275534.1 TPM domain-containing protein [Lachnospiraceae bacterium]